MRRGPLAAALIALLLCGCDARSSRQVSSESIVVLPAGVNLLRNASFARDSGRWWYVNTPAGVTAQLRGRVPHRVLTIRAARPGRPGRVFAVQSTAFLPDRSAGALYTLRVRLRLDRVRRALQVALRLVYAGGGSSRVAAAIRGGGHGWQTVAVRARAARPLVSIDAFVLDSQSGTPFSGSVSIADPRLLSLRARS
jgi:hypothetical protein